jgi:myo-inositol-1(or 4)-monophosphatase
MSDLAARRAFAAALAEEAGAYAHARFRDLDGLAVEEKGHQDLVSDADRATEDLIRARIAERWPGDGIVGEERGAEPGSTGFDWVIDPIDGTANFVRGLPHWCTVIACAQGGRPVAGAIHDPNTGETFQAARGLGGTVGDRPLAVARAAGLAAGSVAIGCSGRSDRGATVALVSGVLERGGMFFRSGSGALMLADVAAGRLLGYVEEHMYPWDCFAALVMIEEAGGSVRPLDAEALAQGTRVVAAAPGVFAALEEIADTAFAGR